LAATVAAALLLRANRLDLMHDWTRNVANWFPSIPDGVVFWTEECRREGHGKLGNDMTAWFVRELSNRSLPFTSDALGIAANFLSDIERKRISADASTRRAAARLKERIGAAMLYFRDDGLKVTPTNQITLLAAIFNGDPAETGFTGLQEIKDPAGINFRLKDPPYLISAPTHAPARPAGMLSSECCDSLCSGDLPDTRM
jgi:hypothetical protein